MYKVSSKLALLQQLTSRTFHNRKSRGNPSFGRPVPFRKSIVVGLVLGSLCWPVTPFTAGPLGGIAHAAGDCTTLSSWYVGSNLFEGYDIGAARVTVDVQAPHLLCSDASNGISVWALIKGPGAGYAQDGWLQQGSGTYGTPHLFTESHVQSSSTTFNRFYWNQLVVGTTHTYETSTKQTAIADCKAQNLPTETDYYFDNSYFSADCVDWDTGSSAQYDFETHYTYNYAPFLSFTSPYFCRRNYGGTCRAQTAYTTTSANTGSPVAPNGCYRDISSSYFEVYDGRIYPYCATP